MKSEAFDNSEWCTHVKRTFMEMEVYFGVLKSLDFQTTVDFHFHFSI